MSKDETEFMVDRNSLGAIYEKVKMVAEL